MTEHEVHRDDVGAYLLGALNDEEREAFERHLRECDECRDEFERLQPAAMAQLAAARYRADDNQKSRRLRRKKRLKAQKKLTTSGDQPKVLKK